MGTGARWRYQPALDGVRALAVVAVMVFHARPDWLPGGFLGVDAFFVLSGFLITGLLLTEAQRTGAIRLAAFWGRRARRLLPALLLVLIAVVIGARYLLSPEELAPLRLDALAALGYVANWRMIFRGGDYFARTAPASLLQHTWSLGIEEQFYLLWPLLVVALLRWRRARSALLALCCIGTGGAVLLSAWLYHPGADPGRVYYGTDSRAGALLTGCALAALVTGRRVPGKRWIATAAALSTALLVLALVRVNGESAWLYRGGLTTIALAVAFGLAHLVASPTGVAARVLSLPPVAWVGRVSYGLYLWHWPLFAALTADRTGLTGYVLFGARIGVTLLVATASFYLVERPIRRGAGIRLVPVAAAAAAVTAATVVIATVPPAQPPLWVKAAAGSAVSAALPPSARPSRPAAAPAALPPIDRPGRAPGAEPRVIILGDSVAWTLGEYMLPVRGNLGIDNAAVQGCGIARLPDIQYLDSPHTNYPGCDKWDQRWRTAVTGDDPDVSAILLDRWELMDRRINGRYQHLGDPDYDTYVTGELNLAISIAAGKGARVVLLTAPYTHRAERPDGSLYPEDTPARVNAWNALLDQEAATNPVHPVVLDLNKVICPGGAFTWTINGLRVRSDGLHFTPAAVQRIIAPWLLPQLTRLATS